MPERWNPHDPNARVLLVLRDPGPKTNREADSGGSGFLCFENDDATAEWLATLLDEVGLQRGSLWSSDAPYQAVIQPAVQEVPLGQGEDLAIAVAVATAVTEDVTAFVLEHHLPVSRLTVLSVDGGPRDNAIENAGQACAMALGIRDEVRRQVRGHSMVHLFLAGPMGLALLLGHRWNRVAPTVVYEDLGQAGYEAAFHISA